MATRKMDRVSISKRALMQRIQRVLAKEMGILKTTRGGESDRKELGDYYTVDLNRNRIIQTHIDLESYGRELKVLKPWEKFEESPC